MTTSDPQPASRAGRRVTRRQALAIGGGAVVGIAAGTTGVLLTSTGAAATAIGPLSPEVDKADAARARSGRTVTVTRTARYDSVDLGAGQRVSTWAYNGQIPGPEIRVSRGDVLHATLVNRLPDSTSIHWHGLALRNDMDGVPEVTMAGVESGDSVDYDFVVPDAGTYWYHSHVGLQLDRGLYGPLIVDDPADPGRYDVDATLMLDDWLDGLGKTPELVLQGLQTTGMTMGGGPGSAQGSGTQPLPSSLGGDAGDVSYPLLLINGRNSQQPAAISAKPGHRLRLRIINAGADTAFRVAIGGHQMTVTHSDGYPVEPVTVDTLLIGMGERYDVQVTAGDGAFPIVSYAEGKGGTGLAVLRTSSGTAPDSAALPKELTGRMLQYTDLRPADGSRLAVRTVNRTVPVELSFNGKGYQWLINGRTYDRRKDLQVKAGERVRLTFHNDSMMYHPMHLHGHTFALVPPAGPGTRKDTVIVKPMQSVSVDLDTVNPGQWLLHCHNAYHQAGGMMTVLSYVQ